MGPDHVLSVSGAGFSEEYKRFYLKDIQAIVIRRTSAWEVVNGIFGGLTALFLLLTVLGAFLGWSVAAMVVDAFFMFLFSVPLLVNLVAGPTCVCEIRTAVQTERLYCLSRMRKALRVTRELRAEIEALQGALAPEDAERLWLDTESSAAQAIAQKVSAQPIPPKPPGRDRPLKPYRSRAHDILFVFLLIDMLHTMADMLVRTVAVHSAGAFIAVGLIVSAVTALIKQQGTDLPRGIRNVAWGTVAYLGASLAFWTVYNMAYTIQQGGTPDYWGVQHYVAIVPLGTTPVLLGWLVACMFTAGILALWGLLLMRRYRMPNDAPPQPPAAPADDGQPEDNRPGNEQPENDEPADKKVLRQ